MKVTTLFLGFAVLILSTTPSWADAGTKDGGGGKGVLCGDHLRTLDLYEAEEVHHLSIPHSAMDLTANLKTFGPAIEAYFVNVDPLDPEVIEGFLKDAQAFMQLFVDLPEGDRLPLTDDATLPQVPNGCTVVQIAIYTESNQVYRDLQYWNRLDPENQAALLIHEALYHAAKTEGAKTSDNIRKVIGLLFARQLPEAILKPVWNASKSLTCTSGIQGVTENFFMKAIDETRDGKTGTGLYFQTFKGELLVGRVSAFLPGITLEEFAVPSLAVFSTRAHDEFLGRDWEVSITPATASSLPDHKTRALNIRAWSDGGVIPAASFGYCYF